MKILFINSVNPYNGSGVFAKIFAEEMVRQGNQVKLVTKDWSVFADDFIVSYHSKTFSQLNQLRSYVLRVAKKWIKFFAPKLVESYKEKKKLSRKINPIYDFMDLDHTSSKIDVEKFVKRAEFTPDIIFVFFAFNFLTESDLYNIYQAYGRPPVFLCMPDTSTITGGCHQVFDCKRYATGCGCCPALYSDDPNDQSRKNFLFKEKYYSLMNITKVYGSFHQERQLEKSLLFKHSPRIKNIGGVNPLICELPKSVCRDKYALPADKYILLFGAQSVSIFRKGLSYLIEALDRLKEQEIGTEDFHLALLGQYSQELDNNLNFPHTFLGFLPFDDLPEVFAASDLFLNPSIEDAGPMMINQSVMCGVPVVAFEMGVAQDIVIAGRSGYMARLKDAADFANGIKQMYQTTKAQRAALAVSTRQVGLEYCSLEKQIGKLVGAFQEAANGKQGRD